MQESSCFLYWIADKMSQMSFKEFYMLKVVIKHKHSILDHEVSLIHFANMSLNSANNVYYMYTSLYMKQEIVSEILILHLM